ncbi:hypothetical protein [Methanosphaera sp. WGK6]|uniref:hypothetical protein n=1 Tax=Methanosphaera sp. WGK6 TaxID=1561964 RepID=UPI00084CC095|nr:hypothetical protein [Methanosphaera sp. WGK6]OED30325.1 hypothetical protein NL43_02800 [Methanosphaera sp. WGK6]
MIVTNKYGDLELVYKVKVDDKIPNPSNSPKIPLPYDLYEWWNSLSENPLDSVFIYKYLLPKPGIDYELFEKIIISPAGIDEVPINVEDPISLNIESLTDENGCTFYYFTLPNEIIINDCDTIQFTVNVNECDFIIRHSGLVIIKGLTIKSN